MDVDVDPARVARMLDHHEIREVLLRYCRGIDRRDYDLVRSCYHPDATDDHGDFRGGVGDAGRARAESYLVAHHHLAASRTKPERDFVAGLRCVDDLERRNGEWRIAARVCAFEWSRIDPVAPNGWSPVPGATVGRCDRSDVVYAPSISAWTS
jgi:SnoaL-like domain